MGSLNGFYDDAIEYLQKGDKQRAIVTFEGCRNLIKITGVKDSELYDRATRKLYELYSEEGNLDKAESLKKEFEPLKIKERLENVKKKIQLAIKTINGDISFIL